MLLIAPVDPLPDKVLEQPMPLSAFIGILCMLSIFCFFFMVYPRLANKPKHKQFLAASLYFVFVALSIFLLSLVWK